MINILLAQAQKGITNPALSPALQAMVPTPETFLGKMISTFITIILIGGVLVFFFFFTIGAIQWMTAGGDKNATEQARSKITGALIGLFILFLAFAVIKLLETMFGIKILTIDLGALIIK